MSLAVTTVAWLTLSFVVPMYLFRTRMGSPRAVEVTSSDSDNAAANAEKLPRSKARRNITKSDALAERPFPDMRTLYDVLGHSVKRNPDRKCMGIREIVRTVSEEKEITKLVDGETIKEKKTWNFYELSEYKWITFREAREATLNIGSGLRHIGVKPGDKLTLFAATSRDWQLVAHASWSQSLTITTAYDTLGEDGLEYSLNECEIETIFTNADLLKMITRVAPKVPTLKRVIYNGEANAETLASLKSSHAHLQVLTLKEVEQLGKEHHAAPVPPKEEDLCCIMYTSGSTGAPKGVMLSHANIVAAIAAAKGITDTVLRAAEEWYLAYLPLAHIFECVVEQLCLCEGIPMGFGTPRTLTDASVRNCKGDLRELRPTLLTGVPAVWETIRKGVATKLKAASPLQQRIFGYASALKWKLVQLGLPTTLLDNTVFKPIRDQTGGRLRFALSGGAPMPKETQKFMTSCVCPVVQGYGMTETCAASVIQLPADAGVLGRVGPPTIAIEVMLVAVEDTRYAPTNIPRPQGEVWLRGPTVMKGYYKNPTSTAETMSADGWLKTGDIGEFYPDGSLAIIDRKKNLVKLAHGEYIALEKLESQYKTCSYVHNICVYADSEQSFAVAIVNPIEKEIISLAESLSLVDGTHSPDLVHLCDHPKIRKAVLSGLKDAAKRAGFKPAEIVGNVTLDPEIWTPENGFLTAAQKLRRGELVDRFKPKITQMYEAGRH
ncbi:hypothetical protein DFS34DRAFT_2823 [Phlyctochytrium arcticum]|nr:hypothetical protein DFS34DRAFT_2823 [Phlyctochytrium arcticum]